MVVLVQNIAFTPTGIVGEQLLGIEAGIQWSLVQTAVAVTVIHTQTTVQDSIPGIAAHDEEQLPEEEQRYHRII